MTSVRLLGLPGIAISLAALSAIVVWFLYQRELSHTNLGAKKWTLVFVRCSAVFMIAMTLAEPAVETTQLQGDPGRIAIVVDASRSMSVHDKDLLADTTADPVPSSVTLAPEGVRGTRLGRTLELLVADAGVLRSVAPKAFTTLQFGGDKRGPIAWDSSPERPAEIPKSMDELFSQCDSPWSRTSPIGDMIAQAIATGNQPSDGENVGSQVVVLLSDGQSNFGQDPILAAQECLEAGMVLYTVGVGPKSDLPELALLDANHPQSVYTTGIFSGTFSILDTMPSGKEFVLQISNGDETIWQNKLVTTGEGVRLVEFSLPTGQLLEAAELQQFGEVDYTRLALNLRASLSFVDQEAFRENNELPMHVSLVVQPSRVLLIDGRSRWETRYLRNMFSRDPGWEIDSHILHVGDQAQADIGSVLLGTQNASAQSDHTRQKLLEYDLVILGDVSANEFNGESARWIAEFVEQGGGLILVDGARGNLRTGAERAWKELIPVRWLGQSVDPDSALETLEKQVKLTEAGIRSEMLRLGEQGSSSQTSLDAENEVWSQLPVLNFVARVRALPGTEVLANAVSLVETTPLIVSRRYGAGRVLYMATDETWKWRYKVADTIHQRLWNQIARWIQKQPMSVSNEFVSLDVQPSQALVGEPVEIRCELRTPTGSPARGPLPATGHTVIATVNDGTSFQLQIPLEEDPHVPGTYGALTSHLPEGEFTVRVQVDRFSQDVLEVQTQFVVAPPIRREMQNLSCNEELLKSMALATGGEYIHESEIAKLHKKLEPIAGGKLVVSSIHVWQSYWWFATAMVLLVGEWILRKRMGLV